MEIKCVVVCTCYAIIFWGNRAVKVFVCVRDQQWFKPKVCSPLFVFVWLVCVVCRVMEPLPKGPLQLVSLWVDQYDFFYLHALSDVPHEIVQELWALRVCEVDSPNGPNITRLTAQGTYECLVRAHLPLVQRLGLTDSLITADFLDVLVANVELR